MCIMKTYETRGPGVADPPPRRGNYTSHSPAGVMRLPREWQRSPSPRHSRELREREVRYVESGHRHSQPRAIEYYEEPRRSVRSVRRVSEVEREPRGSYVDERTTRRSVSRVRY